MGWKTLGVLELTALPSITEDLLGPSAPGDGRPAGGRRRAAVSVLLDAAIGLADLLPSLRREMVYVGVSGGTMVAAPNFGETYDGPTPFASSDKALGLVDFAVSAHLDNPICRIIPWQTSNNGPPGYRHRCRCPRTRSTIRPPSQVVDGAVEVVSEGHWKLFTPNTLVRP